MLPKDRRLRKKADFDRIFESERRINGRSVRIIWSPGEGRCGVVVSKAVGSLAFRNTVKRRWREALRGMDIPNALDLVIVVRTEGAKERGAEIAGALKQALAQLPR
ncbi:MAG: ribonuclease P protein component [Armatimonadetes bacterium]|nr:ribonuclease P protein component [Armatimonadota bacterium]